MAKKTRVTFDSTLNGFGDVNKLGQVYAQIRERVLTSDPVFTSTDDLVRIERTERKGSYSFELYRQGDHLVLLEAYGSWMGYAHQGQAQPAITDAYLDHLVLTIEGPGHDLIHPLQEIADRFPVSRGGDRTRPNCQVKLV